MQDETGAGIGLWDDVPAIEDETLARAAAGLLGDDVSAEDEGDLADDAGWAWYDQEEDWGEDVSWAWDSDLGIDDDPAEELQPTAPGTDDVADDYGTTAVIEVGQSVTGSFEWAMDIDVWRIQLVAGEAYTFALEGDDALARTYLALFDSTGTFIDYDMWSEGLAFEAATGGTYYLAASGDWLSAGGYKLTVTAGMPADEDDDTSTTPTAGNDELHYGDGDDVIAALAGDDLVAGGGGADTIDGGAGDDIVLGEDGDDVITGGAGDDLLFGDAGDDVIAGGAGIDLIFGDVGDDTILLADLSDLDDFEEIDGGEGNDTLRLTGDGTLDLAYHGGWTIWSIETIDARGGADVDLLLDAWGAMFTSSTDTLRIRGDAGDRVVGELAGATVTSAAATTTYAFDVDGYGTFRLIVDNAIDRSGIIV